ncbi:MAG: TraM recognition domain-containing protein [Alphaproteobacteria bacterium]|nr:TraM recognition domain-containing protein [Alphaproteobacteria bacterium]
MNRGRLFSSVQGLLALHARFEQRAYERASRERAENLQTQMRNARPSGVFGRGRLAGLDDAAGADLLDPRGLFLGAMDGRMMFFSGDGHLLTYARTGAGKGRDLVLPNLAHIRNRSVVAIDVKDGELAFASHAHRAEGLGQTCIFLNPFGILGLPNTRVNPLHILIDVMRRGEAIDTQADEIVQILVPPDAHDKSGGWVRRGAIRLLALRMEYLATFDPERCTLEGLWSFVNAGEDDTHLTFRLMAECGREGIARRADALFLTFKDAPKQFEAYRSEAIDALSAFEPGKTLARATAANDFDFTALKHTPHTVYLMAPSDKLTVAAPWVSLVLNLIIEAVAKERGGLRTTFLLDEFPQLPRTPATMKALRLYRGKGIQLWFFSQGRYSMEERWSREAVKEFEDQASILNTTGVEEPGVIADIERWSGNTTVLTRGVNHSGGVVEAASANLGESRRTVLQSEDIRAIGNGRQIIKVAGVPHLFVCDRVPYYAVDPWRNQIRDVRTLHAGETPKI